MDYRTIPLTQGQVALVSAHRFDELSAFKWYASWSKGTKSFYAKRYSRTVNGKQIMVRMHRVIMGLEYGDKRQVDHINGNTLDMRDENLRIATPSENCCNRRISASNSSGLKGVHWRRDKNRWIAQIKVNGIKTHLGYFPNPHLAHAAYCAAAIQYHGEFARTD